MNNNNNPNQQQQQHQMNESDNGGGGGGGGGDGGGNANKNSLAFVQQKFPNDDLKLYDHRSKAKKFASKFFSTSKSNSPATPKVKRWPWSS